MPAVERKGTHLTFQLAKIAHRPDQEGGRLKKYLVAVDLVRVAG